jgi:hypothetical protein
MLAKSRSLCLKVSETILGGFGKSRKVELKRHDNRSKQEMWRKLEESRRQEEKSLFAVEVQK